MHDSHVQAMSSLLLALVLISNHHILQEFLQVQLGLGIVHFTFQGILAAPMPGCYVIKVNTAAIIILTMPAMPTVSHGAGGRGGNGGNNNGNSANGGSGNRGNNSGNGGIAIGFNGNGRTGGGNGGDNNGNSADGGDDNSGNNSGDGGTARGNNGNGGEPLHVFGILQSSRHSIVQTALCLCLLLLCCQDHVTVFIK